MDDVLLTVAWYLWAYLVGMRITEGVLRFLKIDLD